MHHIKLVDVCTIQFYLLNDNYFCNFYFESYNEKTAEACTLMYELNLNNVDAERDGMHKYKMNVYEYSFGLFSVPPRCEILKSLYVIMFLYLA